MFFSVRTYSELEEALCWLVPRDANACMEAICALEEREGELPPVVVPPAEILRLFSGSDPSLLLRYLDARIHYQVGSGA